MYYVSPQEPKAVALVSPGLELLRTIRDESVPRCDTELLASAEISFIGV